jgi:hypothetical protein
MSKRNNEVIQDINDNIIPFELDYNLETHTFIEWDKLQYDFWTTYEFWRSRIPSGLLEQFPCLEYMVDELMEANRGMTPLMELDKGTKGSP